MHWCVAERKGRLEKEKDSHKHPRVRVGCNGTERNGRTDQAVQRINFMLHQAMVKNNLYRSENLYTSSHMMDEKQKSVVIHEGTMCQLCHSRIGNSVFAVLPDEHVVCYRCYAGHISKRR